jgi:hypothetical protein
MTDPDQDTQDDGDQPVEHHFGTLTLNSEGTI